MQYAQLNPDNSYQRQVPPNTLIVWDANNYCTAEALVRDGKAAQFRVVELDQVDPPLFDRITQTVERDGAEFVGGRWRYKWRIVELSSEQAAVNLANARAAKVVEIKAERDRRCQQGGFPASGKWFHSDTFSRSQQLGLVLLGQNIPPDLMWKTMDGTFILMTPALAGQIFASAAEQDAATFKRAEELQVFANNAPDPNGLVLSGWPPIFGE